MGQPGPSFSARQIAPTRDCGTTTPCSHPAALPARDDALDFETWDEGRLLVHRHFARLLREHELTTCSQLFEYRGGDVVRCVGARETTRITLAGADGPRVFYLKRHGPPAWRDRIMPWLHGSRPIHGARNEWEAIQRFIAAGIPTMTPVAFGESGGRSLLMTLALPARCNLLELIGGRITGNAHQSLRVDQAARSAIGWRRSSCTVQTRRDLFARIAGMTRKMHDAGLHHQDFYLNHILLCDAAGEPDLRVIDLGRVRSQPRLAQRWILKDLAQLNFSAERLPYYERLRFLRMYLGRPFEAADRLLVRRIARKSKRIAAHTAKHDL